MAAGARVLIPAELDPAPPVLGRVVHTLEGQTMGTSWRVRIAGGPAADLCSLRTIIETELDRVDRQMSTWKPDSDLASFNRAPLGEWLDLPEALHAVLSCGVAIAQASGGTFDPAAGRLVDAWGFGPGDGWRNDDWEAPAAGVIDQARAGGGWRGLQLEPGSRRVRRIADVALDFSGIAKGYAVDCVAEALGTAGYTDHLVEVGGELRGAGVKPDGQPWWVELEPPRYAPPLDMPDWCGPAVTRVALHGLSIATSGNYRRCRRHGAQLLAHTIDPRTGHPVPHALASVTVLHASCMFADAWSTALTVLGPKQGLAYADQQGIAAGFLWQGEDAWGETFSAAWMAMAQ